MRIRRYAVGMSAFLGMLVLILDTKTAIQGASEGIYLCIRTVIPSLFPFFVLSNMLTSSLAGARIELLRPLGQLCGIPDGMTSLLIPAFLGGYPVGTQAIYTAWKAGYVPKEEAERLLGFCNNPGPSFLFGMAAAVFSDVWIPWLLWGIQIIAAITAAIWMPPRQIYSGRSEKTELSASKMMGASIGAMGYVCGWVVFFRVLIAFLRQWVLWCLPKALQVAIIGILELANGCMFLTEITDVRLRFVMCSVFLSWGGLCVMMQVMSAAKELSTRYFFRGKLLQTILCTVISAAVVMKSWLIFVLLVLLSLIFMKNRKNGSIPEKAGV